MEGPSLHLAAEQLRPFIGRRVRQVSGNSRIGIERLRGVVVRDLSTIFAGVGNIIKNEVLFRTRSNPFAKV